MRATAFSLAEIAFLVCLSSADNLVSLMAFSSNLIPATDWLWSKRYILNTVTAG